MDIEYKLFYKLEGVKVWKHFFFTAESDEKAKEHASKWAKNVDATGYGVEKITKVRLV